MKEPDEAVDRLAHAVIGAAIEVHRVLGPGFLESVYEEALYREMSLRGIPFQRQQKISLDYKGYPVGEARLEQTQGITLGLGGTLDVGADTGTAVDEVYTPPYAFNGEIEKVVVDLKPSK